MIFMDLSQVMLANLLVQLGNHKNAEVDEGMLRHMILNSIRYNRTKFKTDFGELVICADDQKYWRKQLFPYYKANRTESREESELDWDSIFTALNKIKQELKDTFPYRVMQVESTEADDIIGVMIHKLGSYEAGAENHLILSGDKDYAQLHVYPNIRQYNPTKKTWVTVDNPEEFLYEHILRGDKGDGVPNVLMADNSLVLKQRQKPITDKKLKEFRDINNLSSEHKRNYERNKALIDLTQIPQTIKEKILASWEEPNTKTRAKILPYLIDNRLKMLIDHLADF
jgi:5'-3' exonuclease